MSKQKNLIVANWKMNFTIHESSVYLHKLEQTVQAHRDVEVVLAPSLHAIQPLSLQADHRRFKLAAQNIYWRDEGAYTGEVSAAQLRGLVQYALIGHSERRHTFGERDREVRNKVQSAIRNHIRPILCIGETAGERTNGETNDVLNHQIMGGLANITSAELAEVTIAYEPVWAIGSGDNALPHDVQTVALTIRNQLEHMFGKKSAADVRILYGGSITPDNARSYLDAPGIDGLLIGSNSLNVHQFAQIIDKAHNGKDKK